MPDCVIKPSPRYIGCFAEYEPITADDLRSSYFTVRFVYSSRDYVVRIRDPWKDFDVCVNELNCTRAEMEAIFDQYVQNII